MGNTEVTRYSSLTKRRYIAEKSANNKSVTPGMRTNKSLSNFISITANASFFILYPGIHFRRYHRLSS